MSTNSPEFCGFCGYDLQSAPDHSCPECGCDWCDIVRHPSLCIAAQRKRTGWWICVFLLLSGGSAYFAQGIGPLPLAATVLTALFLWIVALQLKKWLTLAKCNR